MLVPQVLPPPVPLVGYLVVANSGLAVVPLRITAGEVAFGDASLLVRGLVCVV